jgi:hypothetical protein
LHQNAALNAVPTTQPLLDKAGNYFSIPQKAVKKNALRTFFFTAPTFLFCNDTTGALD